MIVAATAASLATFHRTLEEPPNQQPTAQPPSTAPPPASGCAEALASEQTNVSRSGPADARPPLSDGYESVTLQDPDDPAARQLLMFDGDWVFSCVPDSTTADGALAVGTAAPFQLSPRAQLPPPAPDDVTVEQLSMHSRTMEGNTGPGWVNVVGHAGEDVVAVQLVLSDGTRRDSLIADGWFAVRGDVADGVPVFEERLEWTLRSGETRSGRVDLLDADGDEERCARVDGCVAARVARLRQTAVDDGRLDQAAILADGVVSTDEHQQALQGFVDCLNANGITASRIGSTLSVTSPPAPSDETRWVLEEDCADENNSLVQEARAYLDAERRVNEG